MRLFIIMRPVLLLLILLTFVFFSCNSNNNQSNKIVILEGYNREVALQDIVSQISILPLYSNEEDFLLGHIKDICSTKEFVYVLDDMTNSILSFDIKTGKFIKCIRNVGQGPNEYIKLIALSSYNNEIYALDFSGNRVIKYDKNLTALETIHLSFASPDFIAVNNGFYFYNISALKNKKIARTDSKGKILDYLLSYNNSMHSELVELVGEHFFYSNDASIYFIESYSNDIIKINNEIASTIPVYFEKNNVRPNLNFKKENKISIDKYAFIADFFCMKQYSVISFIKENKRYYSIIKTDNGKQLTGLIRDNKNNIPFFPRWVLNDSVLIGTCNYANLMNNIDSIRNLMIGDFNINKQHFDYEMTCLLFFNIAVNDIIKVKSQSGYE